MIWSHSSAKQFRQCQRQSFYKHSLASHKSRDPLRREAYLLSKLNSLSAWRGKLVDHVIAQYVLPQIRREPSASLDGVLRRARDLFDLQATFARANRSREPGMTQTKAGEAYAAWGAVEYDEPVTDDNLARAWDDVEAALKTFYVLEDIWARIRAGTYFVAQRSLQFSIMGYAVRAVPDLIVFYKDAAPLIIDWKVHSFGQRDARDQLALYALALVCGKPHADFPVPTERWKPEGITVLEVQLLTQVTRQFQFDYGEFAELEARILFSANEMALAFGNGERNAEDFPLTNDPKRCQRCVYRRLCWEGSNAS
jgi:PD-(D/E)XK nuclease superfamily